MISKCLLLYFFWFIFSLKWQSFDNTYAATITDCKNSFNKKFFEVKSPEREDKIWKLKIQNINFIVHIISFFRFILWVSYERLDFKQIMDSGSLSHIINTGPMPENNCIKVFNSLFFSKRCIQSFISVFCIHDFSPFVTSYIANNVNATHW